MKSPFTQETTQPQEHGFIYEWFHSYLGIATMVLMAHAGIAQWFTIERGYDSLWPLIAWLLLGAHLFSFGGMCLLMWVACGAFISAVPMVTKGK